MTPPSPLATPEPWDLVVDGYVAENLVPLQAFAREALRLAPPRGEVLDVAAGPGTLALLAAAEAARVTAVDFAPAMLAELERRARAAGIANVEARLADGQALPFPDGRFDAAYSMFGVIFFPDRASGLRELARVLRPGGHAVVSSWPPAEPMTLLGAMLAALRAELPPGAGDAPPPLGTPDDVERELRAAGFASVAVVAHEVSVADVTPAEAWGSFSRGGAPVAVLRRQVGEARFAELSRRVVARVEQALGAAPRALRWTALLGVGTRRGRSRSR